MILCQILSLFIHAAYDFESVNTTIAGLAGGIFFLPSLSLDAYQDGLLEQLEGFVLYLEIVQSELDDRDVGNASLSRSTYLVRINQSGVLKCKTYYMHMFFHEKKLVHRFVYSLPT